MIRRLAFTATMAFTLLATIPGFAQERGGAAQEYSLLSADRAHKLGLQYYRQQNYEAALRQFEKAVSLAPGVDTYRASMNYTRLRVAQQQANQKAAKQNMDRLREVFGNDDAEAAEQNDAERPQSDRPGTRAASRRPADGSGTQSPRASGPLGADLTEPRRASDPLNSDGALPGRSTGSRGPDQDVRRFLEPLSAEDMLNEENRKMRLGGGNLTSSRLPPDLPIAGSGNFDLPLFAMPREMLETPVTRALPDDLEPSEDDLESAKAPNPGDAAAPNLPLLDRPLTLP